MEKRRYLLLQVLIVRGSARGRRCFPFLRCSLTFVTAFLQHGSDKNINSVLNKNTSDKWHMLLD